MSRVKIVVVGPTKGGKSTITNILGELQEGPSQLYRPTVGVRVVDLERSPPPSMAAFGKINLELWDCSGEFSGEKNWPAIQKDADGVMFVYDPAQPNHEDILTQLVQLFPRAMGLQPKFCMCYVNHHNTSGGILPSHNVPKCMAGLEKHIGSAEDNQGIFQGFEKYLIKLLTLLADKQRLQEEDLI